jgi:hypothetical protein
LRPRPSWRTFVPIGVVSSCPMSSRRVAREATWWSLERGTGTSGAQYWQQVCNLIVQESGALW